MTYIDKIKKLDVAWYGAAAGAAAAGAALVPNHRIFAGIVGGALVLAIGVWRSPCCAGCAEATSSPAPAEGKPAPESDDPGLPIDFARLSQGTGNTSIQPRTGCTGCA